MNLSNNLKAYFIIVSTIIGTGIFVLPYSFWQSGYYFFFWLFFWFLALLVLHLTFGEILFQTEGKHNLPGLVQIYFNQSVKHLVWFFDYFGMLGVFLIYFIILAKFWSLILFLPPLIVKIVFALLNIYFILKDIKIFAKMESVLSIAIFITYFLIIFLILPKANLDNLSLALKNDFQPLLPYGTLLFALAGTSSLPLVIDLIGKDKKSFFKVNVLSLLTVVFLYLVYTLTTVGFLDGKVSEESLQSLSYYLPKFFLILAVILVTLNITFVDMAFYLKRGLIYDYKIQPKFANLLITFSILPLVFFEPLSLIELIALVSEVFLGFNLLVICIIYLKLKKREYFPLPKLLIIFLAFILVSGIIYGILPK